MELNRQKNVLSMLCRSDYGSPIPLPYLTQRVSAYMHAYTLYSSIRPFGATVILGSWDKQVSAP
jgi:20S proteasome subunit alpha 7